MIARLEDWRDGHGTPGGRAEAARGLDEISDMLTEMRRELLGGRRR
jgi:hypothetical protein